jgi:ech hydrogenase subunit D
MPIEAISVGADTLLGVSAKMKAEGYRFVTMSCMVADEDNFEILYHFDKELRLKHLRLTVSRDTTVSSISAVYFAAFLVENEIQDLFGIRFTGLAVDYERTLYLEEEMHTTPFCKYAVTESRSGSAQLPPESANESPLEES